MAGCPALSICSRFGQSDPGRLYGPDQDGGYRGYPAQTEITLNALDETVGKRLWSFAEETTGIFFP